MVVCGVFVILLVWVNVSEVRVGVVECSLDTALCPWLMRMLQRTNAEVFLSGGWFCGLFIASTEIDLLPRVCPSLDGVDAP